MLDEPVSRGDCGRARRARPYGAELHPPRPGVYRARSFIRTLNSRASGRDYRAENRAAPRILSAFPHYENPPKRAERVSAVALATGLDDRRGSTYASIEGWVLPDPSTHKPGEHLSLIRRRRELRLRMGADPERSAVAEGARVRAASSP